jgi:prephenate dehydrogenase
MRIDTLAVVGVGLIGGCIGLAARRRGAAGRVVGVDNRPEALQRALDRGAVDVVQPDLRTAAAEADVIMFCTPVDAIAAGVLVAAPACRPGTLLTDAGSTKAALVRAVEGKLPAGVAFVGGHPLAGSEKQGSEYSSAAMFEDRPVLLTRTDHTDDNALSRAASLWEALGARVRVMDPDEHDRALATTSHLPHLTASALAGETPPEWLGLTAGGFRDATRVAAGGPDLWAGILLSNTDAVLAALGRLEGRLAAFQRALAAHDREALTALLREGKQVRDGLIF